MGKNDEMIGAEELRRIMVERGIGPPVSDLAYYLVDNGCSALSVLKGLVDYGKKLNNDNLKELLSGMSFTPILEGDDE